MSRYVAAVRAGDADGVRDLLSEDFVSHYDLDEMKIELSFIPAVRADMSAVGRSLEIAFERELREDLAVAALHDRGTRPLPGPRAFAEPLVLEGDAWKVEPFGLDLVYGYPDDLSADPRRPFVSFGVNTSGNPLARLWVDDQEVALKRRDGRPVTFEGRPTLARGRHTAVAFAEVGERVGAIAWTIRIE